MTITLENGKYLTNGKEFKDLNWQELDQLNKYFKSIKKDLKAFRKEQKLIVEFEVL